MLLIRVQSNDQLGSTEPGHGAAEGWDPHSDSFLHLLAFSDTGGQRQGSNILLS
jgi:hypothetical protein